MKNFDEFTLKFSFLFTLVWCPYLLLAEPLFPAGGIQNACFSVCAYLMKFNKSILFLGSRARPPLLSPILFSDGL